MVLPCNVSPQGAAGFEPPIDPDSTENADWLKSGTAISSARILVVDDEADAREVVALILERCGAKVLVASSASEAFKILQQEMPDVLVADIEMPGEDGYSLVRRIRMLPSEHCGRVPAIALTAHAAAHDLKRLMRAGFNCHLPKPLQPGELISAIEALIRLGPERGERQFRPWRTHEGTRQVRQVKLIGLQLESAIRAGAIRIGSRPIATGSLSRGNSRCAVARKHLPAAGRECQTWQIRIR